MTKKSLKFFSIKAAIMDLAILNFVENDDIDGTFQVPITTINDSAESKETMYFECRIENGQYVRELSVNTDCEGEGSKNTHVFEIPLTFTDEYFAYMADTLYLRNPKGTWLEIKHHKESNNYFLLLFEIVED